MWRVEVALALGVLVGLVVANFVPAETACSVQPPEGKAEEKEQIGTGT